MDVSTFVCEELNGEESLLLQLRREMLDELRTWPEAKDSDDIMRNTGIGACVKIIDKHLAIVRKEKAFHEFVRDNAEMLKELYDSIGNDIKRSSDDDVYHKFIKENAEMFTQDNGMKPACEYVEEFMLKLKNGEIKE